MKICELNLFKTNEIVLIDKVYFIISGTIQINNEININQYNIIGENLLKSINGFKCLDDITTVSLEFNEYNKLFLSMSLQKYENLKEEVSAIKYFSTLRMNRIAELCENIIIIYYIADQKIFDIGDKSNFFYILIDGTVEISSLVTLKTFNKIPTGKNLKQTLILEHNYTQVVSIVNKNGIFGHKECIDNYERCSKAICKSDFCIVYGIK